MIVRRDAWWYTVTNVWLARSQALKTKERMAQVTTGSNQMGFGRGSSQPNLSTSYSEEYGRSEGSPASYHGCEYQLFRHIIVRIHTGPWGLDTTCKYLIITVSSAWGWPTSHKPDPPPFCFCLAVHSRAAFFSTCFFPFPYAHTHVHTHMHKHW